MIYIFVQDSEIRSELKTTLESTQTAFTILSEKECTLEQLYDQSVTAIVSDANHPGFPEESFEDCLESIAKRKPVIILEKPTLHQHAARSSKFKPFAMRLTEPSVHEIVTLLTASGTVSMHLGQVHREQVPVYNLQVPLQMLKKDGSLSILTVQAQSFKKIAIEYGADSYFKLQEAFETLLFELWGQPGSFRSGDFLCKKETNRNTYFIFLERSRSTQIPAPGALEKLADRVVTNLQQMLWGELMKRRDESLLPDFVSIPPEFSVGYSTCLYNPCVDEVETIINLHERSLNNAQVQASRTRDRQRELLQTLIQAPNLLHPHFQAVFSMNELTDSRIKSFMQDRSIKHIKEGLYGFESLIRVNNKKVNEIIGDNDGPIYLEARHLRPDVLFSLADKVKLSLELDQACLALGSEVGVQLPGKLMVNILPRNLYFIEQLYSKIPENMEIVLELSESEAINNFELLGEIRDRLSSMNLGIAADDFGKGYAGLERVIKIKPDMIKLDRCLIQNIDQDPAKAAFVHGLVEAAKTSNSRILAEGVETYEEFKYLKEMGAHLIQGYFLHRPQALDEIQAAIGADSEDEEAPIQLTPVA